MIISEDSPIFELERHSLLLEIIFILEEKGEINFQKFIDNYSMSSTTLYRTLGALKKLKIVGSKIDKSTYPKKTVLFLTENGKSIAQKLKEIDEILRGDKHGKE